jgi:CRP-like cAMP-binding protein
MGLKTKSLPAIPFDSKTLLTIVEGHGTSKEYRKKQTVFAQGTAADAIFYIQKGRIKISVVSTEGKEAVVGILGAGDFIGEGCLAGQPLRIATAVAATDCSTLRLDKAATIRALHDHPEFSEMFSPICFRATSVSKKTSSISSSIPARNGLPASSCCSPISAKKGNSKSCSRR